MYGFSELTTLCNYTLLHILSLVHSTTNITKSSYRYVNLLICGTVFRARLVSIMLLKNYLFWTEILFNDCSQTYAQPSFQLQM